jgi:hypothetical protein
MNIKIDPTDKGFHSDIVQSISKSIEIMSYAANFSQSYIMMKIV